MPIERTFRAEIISGGRVTIPKHIREELELEEGDRPQFVIQKPIKPRGDLII